MTTQTIRAGIAKHDQVIEALEATVRENVAAPIFSAFVEEYDICGYKTREGIIRAMAPDSGPVVFFVPVDYVWAQEFMGFLFGSQDTFEGCKIDIAVSSGEVTYEPVIFIARETLRGVVRRSISHRLARSIVDLQTYTGWGTVTNNTFGGYDPLYLSSATARAVCFVRGLDLDKVLFQPNVEWENMVLMLIRCLLQARDSPTPPYVYEGDLVDIKGYNQELADGITEEGLTTRTSERIALIYMYLLSPFYSSDAKKSEQLYRRYCSAISSVDQAPINPTEFSNLSISHQINDKKPTSIIIDYVGRGIAVNASGDYDINCYKLNLQTSMLLAQSRAENESEARFLAALYDAVRLVCEHYASKTLTFAVDCMTLVDEAGLNKDTKLRPEFEKLALVKDLVQNAPYFNMLMSVPPSTRVITYPLMVTIALFKKGLDVKGTSQEKAWGDYNQSSITGKLSSVDELQYCECLATALPTNKVTSYALMAESMTAAQMDSALTGEEEQVKNAVYRYISRKPIKGEWYDEESKRRVSMWFGPKLVNLQASAQASRNAARRSLYEVQGIKGKEEEEARLNNIVNQLNISMGVIEDYIEEVDKKTTTNVDPKNAYLKKITDILRAMHSMISSASEGDGIPTITTVKNMKGDL